MKHTRTLIPLLAIAVIAPAFVSCNADDKKKLEEVQDATVSFTLCEKSQCYKFKDSAADYDSGSDITYSCTASMLMPAVVYGKEPEALRDSIIRTAFDVSDSDFEAGAVAAFKSSIDEFGYTPEEIDMPVNPDGMMSVYGSVASMNERVMSYLVKTDSYAPRAAHGMTVSRYVNYDMKSDSVVVLSDLFTPEGMKKLPGQLRMKAAELVPVVGLTEIEGLPSGNNFYISQSGDIVFVYQPYEIASFAQGTIEIPVEPYTVINLMTVRGKRLFGFEDLQ